jgi:hypothetical protein
MKRLAIPLATGVLAVTTGAVLAFNPLPDKAGPGLERAAEHADRTLPARPADLPNGTLTTIQAVLNAAAAGAEAAAHGAAVSAAAKAEDTTPDTNHGADVSAVARDNHGLATAAERKPEGAGKPDGVGKPDGAGKPEQPGAPEDPGAPGGAGAPDGVGRP